MHQRNKVQTNWATTVASRKCPWWGRGILEETCESKSWTLIVCRCPKWHLYSKDLCEGVPSIWFYIVFQGQKLRVLWKPSSISKDWVISIGPEDSFVRPVLKSSQKAEGVWTCPHIILNHGNKPSIFQTKDLYVLEIQSYTERRTLCISPSSGSLSKWLWEVRAGLVQCRESGVSSRILTQMESPRTWAIICCFPRTNGGGSSEMHQPAM